MLSVYTFYRKVYVMQVLLSERESVDRPAWTSITTVYTSHTRCETNGLDAYKHKHTIVHGRFRLMVDYYKHRRIN